MIVESYGDVIVLSGALKQNFWDTIHTAISLTLKNHPTGVIIDCSQITEVTPLGAETFRSAMEFIEAHDARVIVASVPQHVLEVLKAVPDVRSQLPIAYTVEEARRSLDLLEGKGSGIKRVAATNRRIVACLSGSDSDQELLKVAIGIARDREAETTLIYPIIVPRDLPLQAPLADEEAKATAALDHASKEFEKERLSHTIRVERARDVAGAIDDALEESPSVGVIVSMPVEMDGMDLCPKLVKSILNRVKVPTMFITAGKG